MYATSAKKQEVRAEVRGRGDKTEEESREERYGRGDPQGRREHKDVLAGSVDFSARRKKKMGSECETWPESKCHPAAGETGSVLAVKMTCSSFIGPRTLHRLWIALSSVRLCYRVISPAFPFKRRVSVDSVFPYKICHEQWNHRFVLVVKKKAISLSFISTIECCGDDAVLPKSYHQPGSLGKKSQFHFGLMQKITPVTDERSWFLHV